MESSMIIYGANNIIRIAILLMDMRPHLLHVSKDILVHHLKEELFRRTGIPRDRQRLLYHGRILRDESALSYYNVQHNDRLYLVTRQPNTEESSFDLNHIPAPPNEHPITIHVHGHGTRDYAMGVLALLNSARAMNIGGHPEIRAEDNSVMNYLLREVHNLRRETGERGGGAHLARVPNEQPLVDLLHYTTALLHNLARSVYIMRSRIQNQSRNPYLFEQRLEDDARSLRYQLWSSSMLLESLSYLFNGLLIPTEPEEVVNLPSQTGRRRSMGIARNNGASSSTAHNNATTDSEVVERRHTRAPSTPRDPRSMHRRRLNDE